MDKIMHRTNWRLLIIGGVLIAMTVAFQVLTGGLFYRPENLYNIAQQTAVVGIMATVMVLVIASRNIDLSVGSALGVVGLLIAWVQYSLQWHWAWSILAGVALALLIGGYQGSLVAYLRLPSFIVTLGGLLSLRGAAFLLTSGKTQPVSDPTFLMLGGGVDGAIGVLPSYLLAIAVTIWLIVRRLLARRERRRYGTAQAPLWQDLLPEALLIVLLFAFVAVVCSYTIPSKDAPQGIPIPVLVWGATAYVISFLAHRTRFGRYVFAIGGNPEAAVLVGIPVKRVTVQLFMLVGVLTAVAATVAVARLNAGTNSMGSDFELSVIAAAVIGGAALNGGSGSVAGSIVGALLMQCLDSGMLLLDVPIGLRRLIIGQVLVFAVVFDIFYRRRFGERS